MAWIPFERKGDYEDLDYRHHHSMRRLCGACCVLLCTLLVFSVIVLGVATLIAYLILRPHATHYEIVTATVPVLKVVGKSDSLTDTSAVNAEFVYGVQARNPNGKVTMEYSKFNVQTLFLGVDIGHSSVTTGGLRVAKRSAATVTVTTSVTNEVVNNIVGNTLRSEIDQQYVTVQVKIDTRARAHVGSYTSFWIWIHALCNLNVTPPNNGVAGTLVQASCHNT
jgi:hypothetical protein